MKNWLYSLYARFVSDLASSVAYQLSELKKQDEFILTNKNEIHKQRAIALLKGEKPLTPVEFYRATKFFTNDKES